MAKYSSSSREPAASGGMVLDVMLRKSSSDNSDQFDWISIDAWHPLQWMLNNSAPFEKDIEGIRRRIVEKNRDMILINQGLNFFV